MSTTMDSKTRATRGTTFQDMPSAGKTRAPTAAAPEAARADSSSGARLSQIASGVGYRLRAAAARAWREVEEIWVDAQRLQHGGPR